jgi:hypothetical protein
MKLDENFLNKNLFSFRGIAIDWRLDGIDLRIYHLDPDEVVEIENISLISWLGRVAPRFFMTRGTLYKLIEELKENKAKSKTKGSK